MFKSFVDLLFILLCGTIVLLSQSLRLGGLTAAPAKVGGGGISEIRADQVSVLVVNETECQWVDPYTNQRITIPSLEDFETYLHDCPCIVIVAGSESVTHQRVMDCWDRCQQLGLRVQLGVDKNTLMQGEK